MPPRFDRSHRWLLATFLCAAPLVLGCRPTPPERPEAGADTTLEEILAGSSLPALQETPLPDDPSGTTIHRLSNGMTVYVSRDRDAPRIEAWIAVRAGSRHDPPDSTGLAHYLEHMVFKGSARLGTRDFEAEKPWLDKIDALYAELADTKTPEQRTAVLEKIDEATVASSAFAVPGDYDRLYSTLGITGVNAYTNRDSTVYISAVPPHQFESWAEVEVERFTAPVFRLFYPELESVYEEKNLSLDDPSDIVWERIVEGVFGEHPYGSQTILGSAEHLRTPALADMVAQFDKFYRPNNMAIAIVGNVEPGDVLPTLERTLGQALEPAALPDTTVPPPAPKPGRTFYEAKAPGTQGVTLAWPAPAAGEEDADALDLLDALLANGSSGLLEVELVIPQVVPYATSSATALAEGGIMIVEAGTRPDQDLAETEAKLLAVIDKLRGGEFDETDLQIAKRYVERRDLLALETPGNRASEMLDAFANRVPWQQVVSRRKRQAALTKEDLVALAQRTFGPNFTAVHVSEGTMPHPTLQQPAPTPIDADPDTRSAFAEEIASRTPAPPKPRFIRDGVDYTQTSTPTGTLIHTPNERNSLFSLSYRIEAGSRGTPLVCHALRVLDVSGTAKLDPAARARELSRLGVTASLDCSTDRIWISLAGLDRDFDAAIKLLHTWIDSAVFDPDTVAKVTKNTLASRADAVKDPDTIAGALLSYAERGEQSPWLLIPDNAALQTATPEALRAAVDRVLGYQRTVLYFGPRSSAAVADATRWRPSSEAPPAPPPVEYVDIAEDRVLLVDMPTAKASAYVSFAGDPLPRSDVGGADVFELYLDADMSSVVYQELRERRGLVYSSSAWIGSPTRAGDEVALQGHFASANDRVGRAAQVFLDAVRAPAPKTGFERTLAARRGDLRIDRTRARWVPNLVASWQLAGYDADPKRELWDRLGLLKWEELTKFSKRRTETPYTLALVGDAKEFGDLSGLGTVVTLRPTDVFGFIKTNADETSPDRERDKTRKPASVPAAATR